MRNSHNITLTNNDSLTEDEETTWSLPGAVVGFISWLFALAMPLFMAQHAASFYLHLAFLSGADARCGSGGDCAAFIECMEATLQYCFHPDDSRHYVWRTVYVATGLICTFLSPLVHNSNRN